jgi:hypothetical protein
MYVRDNMMAEDSSPRQAHSHSTCDLRELISFTPLLQKKSNTFDQSHLTSYGLLSSVPNGRPSVQVTVRLINVHRHMYIHPTYMNIYVNSYLIKRQSKFAHRGSFPIRATT